jgi:hypothetical protein
MTNTIKIWVTLHQKRRIDPGGGVTAIVMINQSLGNEIFGVY